MYPQATTTNNMVQMGQMGQMGQMNQTPYNPNMQGSMNNIQNQSQHQPQMGQPNMMYTQPQYMQGQLGSQQNIQQMPYQPDPYMNVNQAINQGYGQFFFNMNDPNIAKTNAPVKQDASMHVAIIVATLILIGGIVGGIILLENPLNFGAGIGVIIGGYLVYVGVSICLSDIRGYITNLKKFDDYKTTYDKMVAGRGYFHFWIECYHYRTVRTKNGTRREKVVTHTATEDYFPRECIDESGNVTGISDLRKYVFVNYLKRFYFTDAISSQNFDNAYNNFISRNRRDQYQNYSQTFEIQGFEPEVGFCMMGSSTHNSVIYFLLVFFGLALPYSCIIQRSVSRYAINILKRLTC